MAHITGEISSHKMFLQQQYILLSSCRKSTRGRYNSVATVVRLLREGAANQLLPDVTLVLKFLTELYEKGCQYSSVTLARSALAPVVTLRG